MSKTKNSKKWPNICQVDEATCSTCSIHGKLMCKLEKMDSIKFAVPFWMTVIIYFIGLGFGYKSGAIDVGRIILYLVLFWGVLFSFLLIWENKVLCSHCPYYAIEEDSILKCYANFGFKKVWKYDPSPMSPSHKIQFLTGLFGAFMIVPAIELYFIQQYLILGLYLAAVVLWLISMHYWSCAKCPNFGCPFNVVPKFTRDDYLRRNPVMRKAWEESGYILNPVEDEALR